MDAVVAPVIETERFRLRGITLDDLDEWVRIKYADPEMMKYMPKSDLAPRERAESAFRFFAGAWSQHGYGAWMVTDKRSGQLLGDCYVEPEDLSGSGEVEIGYDVGREFWGQGVATEVSRAVLRFTFENSPVERIVGVAIPENIGSWRVLERLGFVFEKEARFYDLDILVYAIERNQFSAGDHFYRVEK